MNRPFSVAAFTLSVGLLMGCAQADRPSNQPVQLQSKDGGRTTQLSPGQAVTLRLDSNATTGYSWKLEKLDPKVVENTGHEYLSPDSGLAGAGGVEVWTFTAKSAGTTQLRLEYRRPWERDVAPAKVFEATFNVR